MSIERQRWIVDRFEGELAVVEVDGERFVDLPRTLLPADAAEGDVIAVNVRTDDEAARRVIETRVDREATARARAEARELIDELRERDPGGDVTL